MKKRLKELWKSEGSMLLHLRRWSLFVYTKEEGCSYLFGLFLDWKPHVKLSTGKLRVEH